MTETCVVCGRKGRRACPALSGYICSPCCGKGRRRAINCAPKCEYARAAAADAWRRLAEFGDVQFEGEWLGLLHNLRLALIRVRQGRVREMTDAEACQALANAADTMRVRSKGLVYDFRSPDPHIQMVTDELLHVAGMHEKGDKGLTRISSSDLMMCLRYLERQVKRATELEKSTTCFLDLAAQAVTPEYMTERDEQLVNS